MKKEAKKQTTVYLEPSLKRDLERAAKRRGQSEAAILREALRTHLERDSQPPILAVGESKDGGVSKHVDQALSDLGFGELP